MSNKTLTLYEFDEFRVDTNQRCLWHADQLVQLTPKAFETLLVLIKHRGEIVGKDVLLDEVWADTFVEESTLAQNILTLRKTLAAYKKDTQFIVTVPRRGYRFVAEVREISKNDEIFVVEKHTRTRIVAEQKEIHDSNDASETAITKNPSPPKAFALNYKTLGFGLGVFVILIAGFFAVRHLLKAPDFSQTKFQKFSTANLVSDSEISRAIVSPNGKYLALVKKTGVEAESLIVRQIAEANSLDIVPRFDGRFNGVTFAPESDYIFYTVYPKNSRTGELYKIPLFGGVPQLIVKDIDSAVSISADKKKIAFIRRLSNERETALIVADADGKNERKLAARSLSESFQSAVFSPDGKLISCSAYSKNFEKPMEIIFVDAENGEQKSLTPRNWTWIGQTAWLADGSGVAFIAFSKETPNLTDEVWFVSFPEGEARLLENGVDGVFGVSLSEDGNSLVTVRTSKITSFIVSPTSDLSRAAQLLTKNGDESLMSLGGDWTTDERIVFSTINNGNADVWAINADGSGQRQLTSEASADILPKASADGKFIYFLSNRTGLMSIWRMNADGTNPQKITENQDVFALELAPGGNEIFYTARSENIFNQKLWKISADGSGARQLTEKPVYLPKISPDGKTIAAYFSVEPDNQNLKLTLFSTGDGAVLRQIETPASDGLAIFDWNPDGQSFYLATRENGATTLWRQPVDGGAATKLQDWQNESLFRLDVSKDGKALFYEKGVATNSVLLLRSVSE